MTGDPFAAAVARLLDDDGQHPAGRARGEGWRDRPTDRPAPVDSRILRPPEWATSPPARPRPLPAPPEPRPARATPPPEPRRRPWLRRAPDPVAVYQAGLDRIRRITNPRSSA